MLKLRRLLPVGGHRRPPVGPRRVAPPPRVDHRLDRKDLPGLHHPDGLVPRVVGDAGRAVEEVADAVAAVGADHREAVCARAAGDAVAQVAEAGSRFDKGDGLLQAVVRAFDEGLVFRRDLPDGEGLVEVAVVAAEEGGDVDVDDVPFDELPVFFFIFFSFFLKVEGEVERKRKKSKFFALSLF